MLPCSTPHIPFGPWLPGKNHHAGICIRGGCPSLVSVPEPAYQISVRGEGRDCPPCRHKSKSYYNSGTPRPHEAPPHLRPFLPLQMEPTPAVRRFWSEPPTGPWRSEPNPKMQAHRINAARLGARPRMRIVAMRSAGVTLQSAPLQPLTAQGELQLYKLADLAGVYAVRCCWISDRTFKQAMSMCHVDSMCSQVYDKEEKLQYIGLSRKVNKEGCTPHLFTEVGCDMPV